MTATLTGPRPAWADSVLELLREREPDSAWRREARPEQLAPAGDWSVWCVVSGRGWGKTWSGAHWLAERAQAEKGDYAVIGRSEQDTRETCIEGRSGILHALGLRRDASAYRRGTGQIRLPNGSVIYSFSAESPESLRGPNLSAAWCDELASWRFPTQTWHEGLMLALRVGSSPQTVVTTTPRASSTLLRELLSRTDGSVAVTRGKTFDNAKHLSAQALREYRRFQHTRLGRQELLGELLDDVEGALWNRELIERARAGKVDREQLVRVVVAVDPAGTSGKGADETGIIVAGLDGNGVAWVLDDQTCKLPPDGWARRVIAAREKWKADRIIAERNAGGEMVETVLRTVDPSAPIETIHATVGKQLRAEPVVAYYEQQRVRHVGSLPELEDQMCSWVPGQTRSPDRVDAAVYALTALAPGRPTVGAPIAFPRRGGSPWAALKQQPGGQPFGM